MVFKTIHQKKSAAITCLMMILVLFLMFFCGLRYLDVPEEFGIAINFGTSDVGSGEPKLNERIKSNVEEKQPEKTVEEMVEKVEDVQEDILNQNTEEAPVIEKKKEIKKIEKKLKKEKVETKPVEKVEPKPTKQTQSVLNNLFGTKSDGETVKGEGDDKVSGVKGSETGDPNSDKYYGNNGLGGEGNYLLKGRRVLSKPKNKPDCNEEGVVVVRIEVDANGNVINAVPGVKGTTNNNPCLLRPAKKAALSTKWNADGNAPIRQIGLIRYKFILSE